MMRRGDERSLLRLISSEGALWKALRELREEPGDHLIEERVKGILELVRERGDAALLELTERFDDVSLSKGELRVDLEEMRRAWDVIDPAQAKALRAMAKRIEKLERAFLPRKLVRRARLSGVEAELRLLPIESVGCYVPGGLASYPSSLLMAAIPARLAGVRRLVVCTPPQRDGGLNPLLLAAAHLCSIDELYRVGGAQAIAALAYGTESIEKVDMIVGPGNRYVQKAKLLLSSRVRVDLPAGPSELVIIADESANPNYIARDLLAQAEHGWDSICVLLTDSKALAQEVLRELVDAWEGGVNRGSVIERALKERGLIGVVKDLSRAIEMANTLAPEHLQLIGRKAESLVDRVTSAGLVLVGEKATASLSDYMVGSNHILPTGGAAKAYSGLSARSFFKEMLRIRVSEGFARRHLAAIRSIALAEGFDNHFKAVEARARDEARFGLGA